MPQLSPAGQQAIQDVAQRHGFSLDAAASMLESVINGNGSQAQFNHPEFGGYGQWMQGGMTMIGDMFNNNLKNRVANLCADLSRLVVSQTDLIRTGSFQSQTQNGQTAVNSWGGRSAGASGNENSPFVAAPAQADWWGPDLGWPNSSGGQNGMRYAWFSQAHRLAIEVNGEVTIYDTLDHQIGGVSQQQSGGYSVTFSSQYGYVDLSRLPVVSVNGVAPPRVEKALETNDTNDTNNTNNTKNPSAPDPAPTAFNQTPAVINGGQDDIFSTIEKLASLQARGFLTEQEFSTKKAELLSRL